VLAKKQQRRVEPKDSSVLWGHALDELVSVVFVGEPLGGHVFGEQRFGVMSRTSVRTSIRGHVRSVVRSNLAVPMCPFSIRVQTFPIGSSPSADSSSRGQASTDRCSTRLALAAYHARYGLVLSGTRRTARS
jgi:hypothetical protein